MTERLWTYPRILVEDDLHENTIVELSLAHAHYFKNVLRRQDDNFIRLFNTRDGEWLASLQNLSKKSGQAKLIRQTRTQDESTYKTGLYFAPIKKSRLDILIEKAVELGVTNFHPVITERTENRNLKIDRITSQIHEAAEQCERLTIPKLHKPLKLRELHQDINIHACIERNTEKNPSKHINEITSKNLNFLVGPEGGFTEDELNHLESTPNITPITLGKTIFRAETASIICLTHAMLLKHC